MKSPAPARTCVRRVPPPSQFTPMRGESRTPEGTLDVFLSKTRATSSLCPGWSSTKGASRRSPKRSVNASSSIWSCAKSPVSATSKEMPGD